MTFDTWDARAATRRLGWKTMPTADLIDALCKEHVENYKYRHSDQHISHEYEILEELRLRFEHFDVVTLNALSVEDEERRKAREK